MRCTVLLLVALTSGLSLDGLTGGGAATSGSPPDVASSTGNLVWLNGTSEGQVREQLSPCLPSGCGYWAYSHSLDGTFDNYTLQSLGISVTWEAPATRCGKLLLQVVLYDRVEDGPDGQHSLRKTTIGRAEGLSPMRLRLDALSIPHGETVFLRFVVEAQPHDFGPARVYSNEEIRHTVGVSATGVSSQASDDVVAPEVSSEPRRPAQVPPGTDC